MTKPYKITLDIHAIDKLKICKNTKVTTVDADLKWQSLTKV